MPLHLIDCRDVFSPIKEEMMQSAEAAIEAIQPTLDCSDIDIVFSCGTGVIPHLGYVGICSHAHLVNVYLSPDNPNLPNHLGRNLQRMLAHEVHHCHRHRHCGERRTLAASLIGEGMADHYSLEVFPGSPEKWCVALDEEGLENWWEHAQSELYNPHYNHAAWFFGMGEGFPNWVGYSLGFALMHTYLGHHPATSASSLVATPPGELMDYCQALRGA